MQKITIPIQIEKGYEDIDLPAYQTEGAAGMDLCAAIPETITLNPGEVKLISSGIRLSIPKGFEGQVRPRSGLAFKHGIGILNSPGTIDSDYRGIVGVILFNFGEKSFQIQRGDRIAQLVINRYEKVAFDVRQDLDSTDRESGGFGSTGSK